MTITPDAVRPWIILIIAIGLVIGGFLLPDPTILMLGCTMLGVEPLTRAAQQPPPAE